MEHLFARSRGWSAAEMLRLPNAADAALLHCNKDFASGHNGAGRDFPLQTYVLRRSPRPLCAAGDRSELTVMRTTKRPGIAANGCF
jgi:hypothetical protein